MTHQLEVGDRVRLVVDDGTVGTIETTQGQWLRGYLFWYTVAWDDETHTVEFTDTIEKVIDKDL